MVGTWGKPALHPARISDPDSCGGLLCGTLGLGIVTPPWLGNHDTADYFTAGIKARQGWSWFGGFVEFGVWCRGRIFRR